MSESDFLSDSVIGHTGTCAELRTLIERNTVPHALLFTGPDAVGKRTAARAFAAMLLERSVPDSQQTLTLVRSGNHPDFHMLAKEPEKKDLAVDGVRELCQKLRLKPYLGGCSVAIIDEADSMSLAAANALLMTLEEPTPASYLILVSDAPQRLPDTIVSRCQSVQFGRLAESEVMALLGRLFAAPLAEAVSLTALASLLDGTLAPLGLKPFVHPKTLKVEESKELAKHLTRLLEDTNRLSARLDEVFTPRRGAESLALSLASELASDREGLPFVWQVLRNKLRRRLRECTSEDAATRAQAMLEALQSEQLSKERTLNPQLQLSSVLLRGIDR
ncbi:MAG: AAA family ATPase [Bdellovibrionales bacterium]|nr:AAA family ATPase [Bdellovibrionales bacterium]